MVGVRCLARWSGAGSCWIGGAFGMAISGFQGGFGCPLMGVAVGGNCILPMNF